MNCILKSISDYYEELCDILYPKICLECEILSDDIYCGKCKEKLKYIGRKNICFKCGIKSDNDFYYNICDSCRENLSYYKKIRTVIKYDSFSRVLIHSFKYKKRFDIGDFITKEIIRNYPYSNIKFDFITFIPSHYLRYVKRSYNHTKYITGILSKKLNIPMVSFAKRNKYVKSQSLLKHKQRAENIKNSFKLSGNFDLKNKKILLIEDVITTGSTINEFSRVMSETGADVYVLAFADARNIKEN